MAVVARALCACKPTGQASPAVWHMGSEARAQPAVHAGGTRRQMRGLAGTEDAVIMTSLTHMVAGRAAMRAVTIAWHDARCTHGCSSMIDRHGCVSSRWVAWCAHACVQQRSSSWGSVGMCRHMYVCVRVRAGGGGSRTSCASCCCCIRAAISELRPLKWLMRELVGLKAGEGLPECSESAVATTGVWVGLPVFREASTARARARRWTTGCRTSA